MPNMDHEIGLVLERTDTLRDAKYRRIAECAILAKTILESIDMDPRKISAGDARDAARLSIRIYDEAPCVDETRFTIYDYADGVANARRTVSAAKLLALDTENLVAALAWLAQDKRETYEGTDHMQEPLELDVWED